MASVPRMSKEESMFPEYSQWDIFAESYRVNVMGKIHVKVVDLEIGTVSILRVTTMPPQVASMLCICLP